MEERHPRKLAVILHADVVGSTALVRQDEGLAHARIRDTFGRLASIITAYNGTTQEVRGDALVAEFDRASDAVEAALAFQAENKRINSTLSDGIKPTLRIGISLGEVVFADNTVTGEGVVLAQRLEQMAEPGGVCIQGAIYEAVPGRLPFSYKSLGEQALKGFSDPVRAYLVALKSGKTIPAPEPHLRTLGARPNFAKSRWMAVGIIALLVIAGGLVSWLRPWQPIEEAASMEQMAFPLPSEPSIAVMPFDNMSGDPSQDDIADGFTESLITTLAQMPELFVIARNSTFAYKGKPVKVKQVAEELGVRYVLEGSIQKEGQTLRVNAQLIDALTGHHLWANKYDRDVSAMFAIQDELVRKIFTALQVKLTVGEHGRVWQQGTDNFEAYLTWLEGWKHFRRSTKDDNAIARQLILKAIGMDPDWAMPYTTITWTHWKDIYNGWSDSPDESLALANEYAQKALALDSTYPGVHAALGAVEELKGNRHQAIAHHRKAVALGPNISVYQAILADNLNYAGRPDDAIARIKKAMRLEPTYQPWYLGVLGDAYTSAGKYKEAVKVFEQLLERRPESAPALTGLIVNHMSLGQENKARSIAKKLIDIEPTFTLNEYQKRLKYEDDEYVERLLDALRQAGLSDNPPLSLPDKPSIAVMPFSNMSGDPEQEYFADGITEDLITDLSKISGLFVIARNSSFVYKGKSIDVRQVSRELGVKFLLEGSVRRSGDQVRINAQLIDATKGGHLWAERYDGTLNDVFALQDKVTQKIVAALSITLTAGEADKVSSKGTTNVAAYDAFLQGWSHFIQDTPESFLKAIPSFEKAVKLDPDYGRPYAALAALYYAVRRREWWLEWNMSHYDPPRLMHEYLQKALKSPTALAHSVASFNAIDNGRHEEGILEAERAIAVDVNDPSGYLHMAYALTMAGRPQEAIPYVENAIRLNPRHPPKYFWVLGLAHFGMNQFEKAAMYFERAERRIPDQVVLGPILASTYGHLGQTQKGERLLKEQKKRQLKAWPGFPYTVREATYWYNFKNSEDKERLVVGLRKAGLG